MKAFCASVNFDAFMRFRSSPSQENLAENASFKRSSFQGAEQEEPVRARGLNPSRHLIEDMRGASRPGLDALSWQQRHFPAEYTVATFGIDIERRDRDDPPTFTTEIHAARAIAIPERSLVERNHQPEPERRRGVSTRAVSGQKAICAMP
jgi:hypothetical protein